MVVIRNFQDKAQTQKAAKESIENLFADIKNVPILFLISGGSCHEITEMLSDAYCDTRFTLGVVDERYSTDPTINNFDQLSQTGFFKDAISHGAHAIDTHVRSDDTIEGFSRRFEDALKEWVLKNPQGISIALIGIGRDGHIAGMMGYPENEQLFKKQFEDPDVWVVGYDAGDKNYIPLRVTTTMPFLRKINHSVLYIQGPEKQQALLDVFAPTGGIYETPGRIIHQMQDCRLFTDQAVVMPGQA